MPEDGSLRPHPVRRLLLALARAGALFILVAGIYGAMDVALPRIPVLNRSIASLLLGVVLYELMRRPWRAVVVSPSDAAPDNIAELHEAQHAIQQLRLEADAARQREAETRDQLERRAEAGRNQEAQTRERLEREAENLKSAAARALEEIQRVRAANDELRGQLVAQRTANDELRKQLETQRKAHEDLRGQFDSQRTATDALHGQVDGHRVANDALRSQLETHKAEKADAEQRIAVAARELEAARNERQRARREAEETKQKAEVEKAAQRKTIEADWSAKLKDVQRDLDLTRGSAQKLLQSNEEVKQQLDEERHRMQAELQRMIDESKGERDQMQAEARAVATRLQELLAQLDRERQLSRELGATRARLDEENVMLKKAREAADSEVGLLRGQVAGAIASHEKTRAETQALRQQLDTEWSTKLQTIVGHMASDHETDVGKLVEEREEARAEARSLKLRIDKLEEEVEKRVDEKALRGKIEVEWSEKLQTIVGHMASDHEADVGNLVEEREAAHAEVRNLNSKINTLQARVRELEAPPMPSEPEEHRARADVMQFAEQAFEAYRRATSPGTEPLPPVEEKRARVLLVHHDPALRTMWRDSLMKSGFDVQTAADGQEGLRMVKAEKPDVVIADVSMPKMSGGELCHRIKSDPQTADVKVVLMTGVYTNEMPLDAATKQYEADELLRKPVRVDAMKTALTNLLAEAS